MENENNLESYVFYQSFHEAGKNLPMEQYGELMFILNEYALYKNEPEIENPIIKAMFMLIKPQIEANWRRREKGKYGALGGAPKGNQNAKKQPKNNLKTTLNNPKVDLKTTQKQPKVDFKTTLNQPKVVSKTTQNNPNVNVNVNVNENENVNVEVDSLSPSSFTTNSEYSDKIFAIFSNAGLPCCNNNSLTFLQRDFKNGVNYLHSKEEYATLHSDDVLQACKNYVEVYQDPNTYVTNAYGFEKLVKTKNFADYLPGNFVKSNFTKYSVIEEKEEKQKHFTPAVNIFKQLKAPERCSCGSMYVESLTSPPMVRCEACGNMLEYNYDTKQWE